MKARQRLLAALAGQETDRVPVALYGVYPHSPGDWRAGRASYQPLLELARAHTDPFCQWSVDRGTFYTAAPTRAVELDGGAFVERTIETPRGPITTVTNTSPATQWIRKFYLQDDADVARFLSLPSVPVRPDLAPVHALARMVGDDALLCTALLDGLGVVADLFTPDGFAVRSLRETATIRRMIEVVHERLYDYLGYLLAEGPPSLYILGGPELATEPLMAPRFFDEFVMPYDGALVDLVRRHGSWAAIHCHGRLDGVLERILALGADALHPCEAPPMGDVPLAEVRRRVGRLCLIGNIQIGDIVSGTPEEIERRTREAIRDGAPGGGFILSTTASPYEEELSATALANYRRVVETARERRGPGAR